MWVVWAACVAGRKRRMRSASEARVTEDYRSHRRTIPGVACRHWCAIDPVVGLRGFLQSARPWNRRGRRGASVGRE